MLFKLTAIVFKLPKLQRDAEKIELNWTFTSWGIFQVTGVSNESFVWMCHSKQQLKFRKQEKLQLTNWPLDRLQRRHNLLQAYHGSESHWLNRAGKDFFAWRFSFSKRKRKRNVKCQSVTFTETELSRAELSSGKKNCNFLN